MADTKYSIRTFDGDGSTLTWPITFTGGYIYKTDVHAYTSTEADPTLVPVDFTWVGDNTIKIDPAVPTGTKLTLQRKTQKGTPLVDFNDLAVLNEDNLDLALRQAVLSIAEVDDTGGGNAAGGSYDDLYQLIQTEITERSSADEEFVNITTTLSATVTNNAVTAHAEVVAEATARANAILAEANARLALAASLGDTNAALALEVSTRATADTAEANARLALATTVGNNTAAIAAEVSARTTAVSAEATARLALEARVVDLENSDPSSPDFTEVYAAITAEATARANADGALTNSINTLTSSVSLKTRTYYQSSAPTGAGVGDIWYNTSDGNHPYRWSGSAWIDVADARIGSIGSTVTSLTSQITNEATARANADTAEANTRASAVANLQSQVNTANGNITNINAAVIAETNARVTAIAAQASRTDSLQASFYNAGSQNLLYNPDLRLMATSARPVGWSVNNNGLSGFVSQKSTNPGQSMVGGGESLYIQASGYTTTTYSDLISYAAEGVVGVQAGNQYVASGWVLATNGAVKHLVYIQFYNDAGNVVSTSTSPAYVNSTGGWIRMTATGIAPTGATTARLFFRTFGKTTTPTGVVNVFWDWLQLEQGDTATGWRDSVSSDISSANAAISNEAFVRAAADTAQANTLSSVSTTVGNHTASINTLNSSVNGLKLNYGVALNSSGYVTGVKGFTDGVTSSWVWATGTFKIQGVGTSVFTPFSVDTVNNIVKMTNVEVDTIKVGSVGTEALVAKAITNTNYTAYTSAATINTSSNHVVAAVALTTVAGSDVHISGQLFFDANHGSMFYLDIYRDSILLHRIPQIQMLTTRNAWPVEFIDENPPAGAHSYTFQMTVQSGADTSVGFTYRFIRVTEFKK